MNKLAYSVLYHKPEIHSKGIAYLYSYFYEQDKRLIHIIKECLQSINMKELLFVGFSAKFSQWIVATIIAKEIKKIYKKLPIIIGGFGTPQEAQTILKNFNCFDLSSWGKVKTQHYYWLNMVFLKEYLTKFRIFVIEIVIQSRLTKRLILT